MSRNITCCCTDFSSEVGSSGNGQGSPSVRSTTSPTRDLTGAAAAALGRNCVHVSRSIVFNICCRKDSSNTNRGEYSDLGEIKVPMFHIILLVPYASCDTKLLSGRLSAYVAACRCFTKAAVIHASINSICLPPTAARHGRTEELKTSLCTLEPVASMTVCSKLWQPWVTLFTARSNGQLVCLSYREFAFRWSIAMCWSLQLRRPAFHPSHLTP